MTILAAFQPTYGAGITETATVASAVFTLDPNVAKSGGGNKAACVSNRDSTNGLFFRIGTGDSLVATDADMFVAAGRQMIVSKAETDDKIAVLAAASTVAVHAIPGEGICIS